MKIKKDVAYHCKTIEDAERLRKLSIEQGIDMPESLMDSYSFYKRHTCYVFEGEYWNYSSVSTYQKEGYEIIDFSMPTLEEEVIESKSVTMINIDNVMVEYLDAALRFAGYRVDRELLDKIIDLVELIGLKGGDVLLSDQIELHQKWELSYPTVKTLTPQQAQDKLKELGFECRVE